MFFGSDIHMTCCHTDVSEIRVTRKKNLYTTLDN